MPLNRRYIVEPTISEENAGYNCLCYQGEQFIGKRFFRDKIDADEYGDDWATPAIDRTGDDNALYR